MTRRTTAEGALAPRARATSGKVRARRDVRHWLLKSEPLVFGFADLLAAPGRTTSWEGVRNYQARNFMRDDMRVGDLVLFYHSNADPAGVAGIAEVVREAYPDPTAFDHDSPYHDPKSRPDSPTWVMVDVRAVEPFAALVPLERLRATPALAGMELLRRGSRLSVQPVAPAEFAAVLALGRASRAAAGRAAGQRAAAGRPRGE